MTDFFSIDFYVDIDIKKHSLPIFTIFLYLYSEAPLLAKFILLTPYFYVKNS